MRLSLSIDLCRDFLMIYDDALLAKSTVFLNVNGTDC